MSEKFKILAKLKETKIHTEFEFLSSRSGGAGGQHVNKVNTKIELRFDIKKSNFLSIEQKEILLDKLSGKLTNEGVLQIVSQKERSQLQNKKKCIVKFYNLIAINLIIPKKRLKKKVSKKYKLKRLENKKYLSSKKILRKKIDEAFD